MKQFLAFILLFIYTCVSTGFAVSTHYCMDKMASVELGAVHKPVCAKCGMHKEKSHGCCRDEIKVVKLQQDIQPAKVLLPSTQLSIPLAFFSKHLVLPFYNFTKSGTPAAFQPPPLLTGDTYLKNCVFRI